MNGEMMTARAEKRVKEKSSYRKLITNLQETYPELSQDQALRGILALRAENSGTLTGMTMLEIMEGVARFMKSVKTEYHLDNSDDADAENSSVEDSERPLKNDSDGDDIIVDIESTGSPEAIHESPKIPATVIQKNGAATGSIGEADSTDYYEDDSEDESYNPATSKTSPRKKKTTLKKSPKEGVERSPPKSRGVRKKQEKIELSVEDIEAEFPKICRKRKFPSHLNEYALPYPEEEADVDVKSVDDEDDLFKISPKPKNGKKKKAETDKNVTPPSVTDEIIESSFVNGVDDGHSTVEKLPRNKNIVKQLSAPKFGICGLCGISFDESSKKVNITEKTRETGQPFADVLQRFCREEKLLSSVTDINFDSGLLCTLCVSYIDQLDVFQQKLTEIKSSIIKVLMRNGKNENSPYKSDSEEVEGTEEVVLPKKRGRPPKTKSGKMVTLVYQSPLQEPKAVPTPSPDKSVSATSPTDGNIAHKLSVLSGIEIKRINTETGEETDARLDLAVPGPAGQPADKDVKVRKKRSPNKKKTLALQVTDKNFEDACQSLEDELVDDPPVAFEDESVEDRVEVDGLSPRTEPPVCPPSRGRGRGRGRGRPILSQRPPPPPPLQKSRKSLFESSQERRRSGTPLMTPSPSPCPPSVNGFHLTPATPANTAPATASAKLYSVPVTPLLSPAAASTPLKREAAPEAELRQKKAYRKLVARIRGAHPEISSEEALRGVVAVRAANQGTLTGMSMQEIIAKVKESVLEAAAASSVDSVVLPIGEEFERMVNAPLPVIESPEIEQQKYFELKCQFCSRLFKSSSESATRKVYEIHMHEHDLENRNIYQECSADEKLSVHSNTDTEPHDGANHTTESQKLEKENVPCDLKCDPDPVRSESSYCKLCHKQFKNSKLYGIHQNSEHAAEKEFEKISHAS